MLLHMLNDLAEAMKALDGKKSPTAPNDNDAWKRITERTLSAP